MSKIEQIISEIERYLDGCKPQAFSNNRNIIVEKNTIDELLAELRMETPEEIRKYQKIISNKDAILNDAKTKASAIIDNANRKTEKIVSEHEIMTQAHNQASEMLSEAQEQARQIIDTALEEAAAIREGAMSYTDDQLVMLQNILNNTLSATEAKYNAFMDQLQDQLNVVTANRKQLASESAADAPAETDEEEVYSEN